MRGRRATSGQGVRRVQGVRAGFGLFLWHSLFWVRGGPGAAEAGAAARARRAPSTGRLRRFRPVSVAFPVLGTGRPWRRGGWRCREGRACAEYRGIGRVSACFRGIPCLGYGAALAPRRLTLPRGQGVRRVQGDSAGFGLFLWHPLFWVRGSAGAADVRSAARTGRAPGTGESGGFGPVVVASPVPVSERAHAGRAGTSASRPVLRGGRVRGAISPTRPAWGSLRSASGGPSGFECRAPERPRRWRSWTP